MKFTITKFDKKDTAKWNEFLSAAKNSIFLFDRAYMEYHGDRFTDHSLMIHKENKLVALFPANESDYKIHSHAGLTYGGLLVSRDIKTADTIEVLDHIINYYIEKNFIEFFYKAIPYIFHNYPGQEDMYALFRHNASLYRRDVSSVIDLSNPIRFSETKRQAVTKCIQANVTITENDDFSEYWNLLVEVLSKFNALPVHSIDEIMGLKSIFKNKIRLFEARLNDELLAGAIIYDYSNVVHTQYLANSEKGRSLGALDFISFQLISGEFKDRKYFSFGTSTTDEGKVLNEGLVQQKENMGARTIVNDFYKILLK